MGPRIEVVLEADDERAGLYRVGRRDRGIDENFNGSLVGNRQRTRLCTAPCRLSVAPGEFVVGGQRLRESRTFYLSGEHRHVHLDAEIGTEGGMMGGMLLTGAGAFTLLVSLPIVIVGSIVAADDGGSGLLLGGGVAAAAGAGMIAGGIVLIVDSKTNVSLSVR